MGGKGYTSKDPSRINFIGNYHPDTPFKATPSCTFYIADNKGEFSGGINNNKEFKVAPVITSSALIAKKRIISSAGAIFPERDAVDKRIIELIKANKGQLINSQKEVGAWPALKSQKAPLDSDNDGMPDSWENENKLNLTYADHNLDPDNDGYTNLEEFLNSSDPQVKN